jgi:hypothetical protein
MIPPRFKFSGLRDSIVVSAPGDYVQLDLTQLEKTPAGAVISNISKETGYVAFYDENEGPLSLNAKGVAIKGEDFFVVLNPEILKQIYLGCDPVNGLINWNIWYLET